MKFEKAKRRYRRLTPAEESFFSGFSSPTIKVNQPLIPRPQDRLPVGTRVLLFGNHPHAGTTGTIDRWETVHLFRAEGPKPVVRLDNGHECFVMDSRQYGRVPA